MANLTPPTKSKSPARLLRSWRLWLAVFGAIVVLAFPVISPSDYVLRIAIWVIIDIPLVLSQNLITGFTGLLTLGQAAFYGIGAYTSALLVMRLGVPWPIALVASGLVACVFGILLSIPCLRVGSDYLTLVTISFGEVFYIVALNWMQLTRGPMGIPGVPSPQIGPIVFSDPRAIYFLYLFITSLCYLFMHRLTHSHIGRALIAIRDNETAAAAMGVNVRNYKILAFAFGTMWAGISGSMLAHFLNFVGPQTFTLSESILHMQMAILGGLGSLPGSILGALILISLPQLFQPIYQYQLLLNGLLMIILLTWRPQGILGKSAVGKTVRKNFLQMVFGGQEKKSKGKQAAPPQDSEILDVKR